MDRMQADITKLPRSAFFSELDLHFARLMTRLAGQHSLPLWLGALLVSRATSQGSVCINLHTLAGQALGEETEKTATVLFAPEAQRWMTGLRKTNVVGQPGEFRPLILDNQGRLYLYRYWDYERRLADDLLIRAGALEPVNEKRLREDLARLFPRSADGAINWQKIAAAVAVLRRFCVISGGPGTGKTTVIARVLALLSTQAGNRRPRIALAAPTGKAAMRLQESLRLANQELDLNAGCRAAIPEEAFTLHRLLGVRNGSVYFRYNADNPLPLDVLVIDEASMVDLALMAKLVTALPPGARLILLGDKEQLASVEAGSVLGDICGSGAGFSEDFRVRLEKLSEELIPAAKPARFPLQDSVVLLQQSYRFGATSGVGKLARAVQQGDGEAAMLLLESGRFADLAWRPMETGKDLPQCIAERVEWGFQAYLEVIRTADLTHIFQAFNRFRVLCALRNGPFGVQALNRLITDNLDARRLINARQTWYLGRPVMVTHNDYNLHLFNGDIGIALPDAEAAGQLRVFFQTGNETLRCLPPTRLPAHETVFATTIHKSQGSEFNHVLMVLPCEISPIMTRELIYTGITRARESVEIWSNSQVFKAAVERGLWRSSGLQETLWGAYTNSY